MKYEYKFVKFKDVTNDDYYAIDEDKFQKLGEEGWVLCESTGNSYIFCRVKLEKIDWDKVGTIKKEEVKEDNKPQEFLKWV